MTASQIKALAWAVDYVVASMYQPGQHAGIDRQAQAAQRAMLALTREYRQARIAAQTTIAPPRRVLQTAPGIGERMRASVRAAIRESNKP